MKSNKEAFPRLMALLAGLAVAGVGNHAWRSADVHAHGGPGLPVLTSLAPARGVIQDVTGEAHLRWTDEDPDDNASLRLLYTPDILDPEASILIGYQLEVEDCDPSDAGPVFTGLVDAGPDPDGGDGGAAPPPQSQLDEMYCRATPVEPCDIRNDCWAWDTHDVPAGNYFILGALDDHWPDGGGGNVSFRVSRGIVRVRKDGGNVVPAMLLMEPDGVGDLVDTCFRVRWVDDDPDNNATIKLWLVRAFGLGEPVLIAENLSEDDLANGFDVDMSGAQMLVDYQVVAEISDGVNPPWRVQSDGYITRYVRMGDGGVRISNDGGCVGPPPHWPNDAGWPDAGRRDAGGMASSSSSSSSSGGGTSSSSGGGTSSGGGASSSSGGGSSGTGLPGCGNQLVRGEGGAAWLGLLLLLVAARRARR